MAYIIGLDFGNYNTFSCFIQDFDEGTRLGGRVTSLMPPNARYAAGIPSVYFYSEKRGELFGEYAVRVSPYSNQLRYLKRHMGETKKLDDRTIAYDDAIVSVLQHCIRSANRQLWIGFRQTTNLVSLAYPASYSRAQLNHLIELAEHATLEDGTRVKVYGTIAEPAAAALDYLAEYAKTDKNTTVLTYDLGGGTFDLGLVSVYPRGKQSTSGRTYYYDIVNTRGINVGGNEFDEVMFGLLKGKIKDILSPALTDNLHHLAVTIKENLTDLEEDNPQLLVGDESVDLPITRKEFEEASRDLLMQTIEATKQILEDHSHQAPEIILLTGGASQMPMVINALENALPQYKGKIFLYRPERAVAQGAARYGTSEPGTPGGTGPVFTRLPHSIGIRFYKGEGNQTKYINTFLEEGTELPCISRAVQSKMQHDGRVAEFHVYEAIGDHPDPQNIGQYKDILSVNVDHGKQVSAGTLHESRIKVDKRGMLTVEARDLSVPDAPYVSAEVQLNLDPN
ncbi:MAG: Hsp70 family protein [Lachnospiraceae bacterium]|nr:Hsp70 family protein [Lachnospiraceae bacterium]